MKGISWKDGKNTLWETLGISPERAKKLLFRMERTDYDFFAPQEDEEAEWSEDDILKLFCALAENPQELILAAYLCGKKVQSRIFQEEINSENEE
jgi:hypothetical protein